MNNKGFTLIELLTVIVLLSIISIISFVSINAVINKNKDNDCVSLVMSIKSAIEEYISDNRYNSEFTDLVIENNITLSGSVLANNGYLKGEIVNPYNSDVISYGDISAKITLYDDYTVASISINSPEFLNTCQK